jgi:drug/metabolite transporter (DMT)-like permease
VNILSDKTLILILIGVLSLIWGSSYILMTIGLKSFTPYEVSALRYVFALLAIAPFAFKKLSQISRSDWPWIMVVTFVGTAFPGVVYPTAVQYVDSSVIGIINALTPLFTLCIGLAIFRLRLTLFKGLGVLLGLLGATLLILAGSPSGSDTTVSYALLAVLAPLCYGISTNVIKSKLGHLNPLAITMAMFIQLGLLSVLFLACSPHWLLPMGELSNGIDSTMHLQSIAAMVVLGGLGTSLALFLFYNLIQRTSAVAASTVTYMMPLVALFWGKMAGELIDGWHAVGVICIFAGIFLVNRKKKGVEQS